VEQRITFRGGVGWVVATSFRLLSLLVGPIGLFPPSSIALGLIGAVKLLAAILFTRK
jgi:hypothetical protein